VEVKEKEVTPTQIVIGNLGEDGQRWITPPKTSRSPRKATEGPKYGAVTILSNPYSALSEVDEVVDEPTIGKEGVEKEIILPQDPPVTACTTTVVDESRGTKDPPSRQYLPRGSKTAHKTVSTTQSARNIPNDQSKRNNKKSH